jgi:hypothetical protein
MASSRQDQFRTSLDGSLNTVISVILKLDFEKAFHKIEHKVIIQLMERKGFGPKWEQWMHMILNSGTSSVLHNGDRGIPFHPIFRSSCRSSANRH